MYDAKFNPRGQSLPAATRAYRVEVLEACFEAIALHKLNVDSFCNLLEHDHCPIGSRIADLIPVLSMVELKRLRADLGWDESSEAEVSEASICGPRFSLIWDGTTHFCEVFALIILYVDKMSGRVQKDLLVS